jgi:pimeloyl-ACP methyl ester carboxylesterase
MQHSHRCIAVDRPGHGISYRVDYGEVSNFRADAAAFVGRTLDLLGLERATLVANSMGAFFAIVFALAHPERVARLVLVGAPAGIVRGSHSGCACSPCR